MKLTLSISDYNFFCKYADTPFAGFDVSSLAKIVELNDTSDNAESAWKHFEEAYDDAYLVHVSRPDYEPDAIGRRLERVSDNLVDQTYR